MQTINITQIVRCPNCGGSALRRYYSSRNKSRSYFKLSEQLIQTECPICDYSHEN